MVKLAVFLENWPCKTRLHGSLAKPLIQDNIAPPAFFSADAHDCTYLPLINYGNCSKITRLRNRMNS